VFSFLPVTLPKPRKAVYPKPSTLFHKRTPKTTVHTPGTPLIKLYRPETTGGPLEHRDPPVPPTAEKKNHVTLGWVLGICRGISKFLYGVYLFYKYSWTHRWETLPYACPFSLKRTTTWPAHRILHDLFSLITSGAAYISQGHVLQPPIIACVQNSGFNKR
jgi:hypothetical protein